MANITLAEREKFKHNKKINNHTSTSFLYLLIPTQIIRKESSRFQSQPTCPTQTKREKIIVPSLRKNERTKMKHDSDPDGENKSYSTLSLSPVLNINTHWSQSKRTVIVPDAKHPVYKESPKEAENHVGPGVPGVQLHELRSVQVQILVRSGRKAHQVLNWNPGCIISNGSTYE